MNFHNGSRRVSELRPRTEAPSADNLPAARFRSCAAKARRAQGVGSSNFVTGERPRRRGSVACAEIMLGGAADAMYVLLAVGREGSSGPVAFVKGTIGRWRIGPRAYIMAWWGRAAAGMCL